MRTRTRPITNTDTAPASSVGVSRRRLTGLHFERVLGARCRGLDRSNPDAVLNLLAITFDETQSPSGTATLLFSDGAAIQIDCECVESQMKDLGPVWEAEARPIHAEAESA